MQNLWAPWRAAYVLGETEAAAGCIFCVKPARGPDHFAEELILHATPEASVMMNAFPYNNGHVLVAPRAHVARVADLAPAMHDALFRLVTATAGVLERALSTEGMNIGINVGRVAGAGITDHAHVHLVPRWNGDTNFMPVLGEAKVIAQHLAATYAALRPYFVDLDLTATSSQTNARSVHGS
jgi:ATP adenylyltransferase